MYPPEFNDKLKNKIRERDQWTCAVCDRPEVHVHHINYIKEDCHELNLITLCERCHPTTNGNRDEWRWYLTKIVATKPRLQMKPAKVKTQRKRREKRFASQRQYAQYNQAKRYGAILSNLDIHSYCMVLEEAWDMYRRVLMSRQMPYLSIPQANGTCIVLSPLGVKKIRNDITSQLYEWMIVKDRTAIGTSKLDV